MRLSAAAITGQDAPAPLTLSERLSSLLIPGCVFFNFFLCFVNTRITTVPLNAVIGSEMILISLSAIYGFFRIDPAKLYWLIVMIVQVALGLLLSLAKDELLMKAVRDMIIMPIFIVLGLSSRRLDVTKTLLWLSVVIMFFTLYEGYFLESFLKYFNIRRYYIEKGVIPEDYFLPYDLIFSGVRPNHRFLIDIPGVHRVSSVFLEPVSLGFFGFMVGLYFLSVKKNVSHWAFCLGMIFAYGFIWLSDARMAFGSLTLMILARPVISKLDHRFSALVFPIVFSIASIIYLTGMLGVAGDTMGWRINDTFTKLSVVNPDLLMGTSRVFYHAEDSGLLKILQFQGLLGFMLQWLAPVFFMRKMPAQPRIYLFGLTLFLSFGYLLSAAILSLKTASVLWFLYGYLIAKYTEEEPETAENGENQRIFVDDQKQIV